MNSISPFLCVTMQSHNFCIEDTGRLDYFWPAKHINARSVGDGLTLTPKFSSWKTSIDNLKVLKVDQHPIWVRKTNLQKNINNFWTRNKYILLVT